MFIHARFFGIFWTNFDCCRITYKHFMLALDTHQEIHLIPLWSTIQFVWVGGKAIIMSTHQQLIEEFMVELGL